MNEKVFRYRPEVENLLKDITPDSVIKVNISDIRFYYAIEWIDGEKFNLEIEEGEYVYTHTAMPERNPIRTDVSKYETEELAVLAWLMGVGACVYRKIGIEKIRDLVNRIVRENDFGINGATGEDRCLAAFEDFERAYLDNKDKKEHSAEIKNMIAHKCITLYYELLNDEKYSDMCESTNKIMSTILHGRLFDVCILYDTFLDFFYREIAEILGVKME